MRKERSLVWVVTVLLVVSSLLLASCGGVETEAPADNEPPAATEAPATDAPAATEPPATEAAIDRNYSPDIPDPAEPVTITFASFNDLETPYWQGLKWASPR